MLNERVRKLIDEITEELQKSYPLGSRWLIKRFPKRRAIPASVVGVSGIGVTVVSTGDYGDVSTWSFYPHRMDHEPTQR